MPVYKVKGKPGQWRVVIWHQGERQDWVLTCKRSEAEAFEARKRVELAAHGLSSRVSPNFADFCADIYEPHARAHLRSSTWDKVRVYQIQTLASHFGQVKLSDISAERVETFKRARLLSTKPSTVNNELRVLRTILTYAKSLGYPTTTATWKKVPVRGNPRVHVWSSEQLAKLFDAARAEAPELVPMLVFLANTGCRKGEAIACEWSWIDWDRELIRIPSTEAWRPKNGLPREVPLSLSVKAVLSGPRAHERWCFPTRLGGRYAEFPKDLFSKVRTAAGLAGGPHTLRHSYASLFLATVPDMFLLAQVLGHSHTRISEIYSHLLPGHLERAKGAVDVGPKTVLATVPQEAKIAGTGGKSRRRH